MLNDGLGLGISLLPVAKFGDFGSSGGCCKDGRCRFNWECREEVHVTFNMTPVILALQDLADSTSLGIII